jgi:hypothetical protein
MRNTFKCQRGVAASVVDVVRNNTTLSTTQYYFAWFICTVRRTEYRLRLPHSLTTVWPSVSSLFLIPDRQITLRLRIYHLLWPLPSHSISSKCLESSLCPSTILFSRVTPSTHFDSCDWLDNERGFFRWLTKFQNKNWPNSMGCNIINFPMRTKHPHKV